MLKTLQITILRRSIDCFI